MAQDYEVKPGQGSVWPNDRKDEDWHADWRGKILLPDGSEHYIDVWDNEKNGKTWRGIKIGNPVAGANTGTQAPVQNTNTASESLNELEDDLPF
jgi:hypothetical protein|tara:strand:+ start:610 stop:891 length:282 start_codon:yes stop_codon:yes gene_type:complete